MVMARCSPVCRSSKTTCEFIVTILRDLVGCDHAPEVEYFLQRLHACLHASRRPGEIGDQVTQPFKSWSVSQITTFFS